MTDLIYVCYVIRYYSSYPAPNNNSGVAKGSRKWMNGPNKIGMSNC